MSSILTSCRPDTVPYETFAPMHEMKRRISSSESVAATAREVIEYRGHQYRLQNNHWQDSCTLKYNSASQLAPLPTKQEIESLREVDPRVLEAATEAVSSVREAAEQASRKMERTRADASVGVEQTQKPSGAGDESPKMEVAAAHADQVVRGHPPQRGRVKHLQKTDRRGSVDIGKITAVAVVLLIIAGMVTMVVVGALGLRGVIPMNRHLAKSLIIIPLMPIACALNCAQ